MFNTKIRIGVDEFNRPKSIMEFGDGHTSYQMDISPHMPVDYDNPFKVSTGRNMLYDIDLMNNKFCI